MYLHFAPEAMQVNCYLYGVMPIWKIEKGYKLLDSFLDLEMFDLVCVDTLWE